MGREVQLQTKLLFSLFFSTFLSRIVVSELSWASTTKIAYLLFVISFLKSDFSSYCLVYHFVTWGATFKIGFFLKVDWPFAELRRNLIQELKIYAYLQNKRCGGAGCPPPPPPPIIFERLKLPQQIIYRRKGNLSESPNHQKYLENILVSRFYEQF